MSGIKVEIDLSISTSQSGITGLGKDLYSVINQGRTVIWYHTLETCYREGTLRGIGIFIKGSQAQIDLNQEVRVEQNNHVIKREYNNKKTAKKEGKTNYH